MRPNRLKSDIKLPGSGDLAYGWHCSGKTCWFLICSLLLFGLLLPGGCGGKYRKQQVSTMPVEATGVLALKVSTPFPMLVLQSYEGKEYLVRSPELFDELKRLQGMKVVLKGHTPAKTEVGLPVLVVSSYSLSPLPGKETPIIGLIEVDDGKCFLRQMDGAKLLITGEFANILSGFPGAKVWVIGEEVPESEKIYRVFGYGMIKPAE